MGDAGEGNPGRGLEVGQARYLLASGKRPEWPMRGAGEDEDGQVSRIRLLFCFQAW